MWSCRSYKCFECPASFLGCYVGMPCAFPLIPLNSASKAVATSVRFTTSTCMCKCILLFDFRIGTVLYSDSVQALKLHTKVRNRYYVHASPWRVLSFLELSLWSFHVHPARVQSTDTFLQQHHYPSASSVVSAAKGRSRSVCDNRASIVLLRSAVSIFDMPCLDSLHKQTLAYTAKIANDHYSKEVMPNFCYPLVPGLTISTSSG
jgi:hypothetical protein